MSQKMKQIADMTDFAINERLWDGRGSKYTIPRTEFSCIAIRFSCRTNRALYAKCRVFLRELGCSTKSENEFDEFSAGVKRQYARALWLTWAAMIAREEGI